jgi:hypothetical protein
MGVKFDIDAAEDLAQTSTSVAPSVVLELVDICRESLDLLTTMPDGVDGSAFTDWDDRRKRLLATPDQHSEVQK